MIVEVMIEEKLRKFYHKKRERGRREEKKEMCNILS